jgi:transcriptional regulator GlxA family with amidase domain
MSRDGGLVASSGGASRHAGFDDAAEPDTLIVVGGDGVEAAADCRPPSASSPAAARACAHRQRLLGPTCWRRRPARRPARHHPLAAHAGFRTPFPAVRVEADRIFTQDGKVWTSAGISAGIDLALALIADDLGEAVARQVARQLVVYYRRPGGQSQFSELAELQPAGGRFAALLDHIRSHLQDRLDVDALAAWRA